VHRLRELYHLVVSTRPSPVLTREARYALLATGVALARGAISGRGRRDELVRTSSLVAIVSLGDGEMPDGSPEPIGQGLSSSASFPVFARELRTSDAKNGFERPSDSDENLNALQEMATQLTHIAHEPKLVDEKVMDKCACSYWMQCFLTTRGVMLEETTGMRNVEQRALADVVHDPYAKSLVEAADAELGQIVFRDLILSFRLPRYVVRQRRTLVLEREQTQLAEQHHADALNRAHSAAMQSPSDVWIRGAIVAPEANTNEVVGDFMRPTTERTSNAMLRDDAAAKKSNEQNDLEELEPVERTCVLLAALAMNLSQSADAARTGDAFGGRVELPFLATRAPPPTATRIALRRGEWFYYRMLRRPRTGSHLEVLVRGPGLAGLLACAMAMLADEGGLHAASVSAAGATDGV
jgi:hypothetical protein